MENSSPNSAPPQNMAYFSDGNVLRDIGNAEGRLNGHDREFREVKDELSKIRSDISALREWRAYLTGGIAVASVLVPLLMKQLGWL